MFGAFLLVMSCQHDRFTKQWWFILNGPSSVDDGRRACTDDLSRRQGVGGNGCGLLHRERKANAWCFVFTGAQRPASQHRVQPREVCYFIVLVYVGVH